MKIRVADWRDRDMVQRLRAQIMLFPSLDGGLYELLRWPIFLNHVAVKADGGIVGLTSAILISDTTAESNGLVVDERHRQQGIASRLRGTQARDLGLMGVKRLYCSVDIENVEAVVMVKHHFPEHLGLLAVNGHTHLYQAADVADLETRVALKHPVGTPTELHKERLSQKAEGAKAHFAKMQMVYDMTEAKTRLRREG